jgi:LPXTG-motif cell wall-anchored protein
MGAIALLVLATCAVGASEVAGASSSSTAAVPFANCAGVSGNTAAGASSLEAPLSLTSGTFQPGGTGEVHVSGAQPGKTYNGIVSGASPISLLPQAATAAGHLNYSFAVPASFEIGVVHNITLYRDGVRVGNFDFCVVKPGTMAPTTSTCTDVAAAGGGLPKTGTNHLPQLVLAGLVALATGASALYARKRLHADRVAV